MKYSIAEQIKFYMDIKGMTQQEVARKIGVGQNTISRWINNVCEPGASDIYLLAALFDCSPNDLFEWNEQEKIALQAALFFESDKNSTQSKMEDEIEKKDTP